MRHFSLTFRRICPIEWGLGYSYGTFQIYPLILSHKVVIVLFWPVISIHLNNENRNTRKSQKIGPHQGYIDQSNLTTVPHYVKNRTKNLSDYTYLFSNLNPACPFLKSAL